MRYMTIFALLAILAACAHELPEASVTSAPQEFDYEAELAKLRAGDPEVDYLRLRLGFVDTAGYSPYGRREDDLRDELYAALGSREFEKALEVSRRLLDMNYFYPDAHVGALVGHSELGHEKEAAFHGAVINGLFESICVSGRGQDPATPWVVISTNEEYFVLNVLGLSLKEQALTECDGKPCDAMTAVDDEDGQEVTLYFDISLPYMNMFGGLFDDEQAAEEVQEEPGGS